MTYTPTGSKFNPTEVNAYNDNGIYKGTFDSEEAAITFFDSNIGYMQHPFTNA